jgi:hypothetical protein
MSKSLPFAVTIFLCLVAVSFARSSRDSAFVNEHLKVIVAAEGDSLVPEYEAGSFRSLIQYWVKYGMQVPGWDSINSKYQTFDSLAVLEYSSPLNMGYFCYAILQISDTVHLIYFRCDTTPRIVNFLDSALDRDAGRAVREGLFKIASKRLKPTFDTTGNDAPHCFVFLGRQYGSQRVITNDLGLPHKPLSPCGEFSVFMLETFRPLFDRRESK